MILNTINTKTVRSHSLQPRCFARSRFHPVKIIFTGNIVNGFIINDFAQIQELF